jgi:hypothetical protein
LSQVAIGVQQMSERDPAESDPGMTEELTAAEQVAAGA